MLDKTCKLFQDGDCPIEYDKCTSWTACEHYKRDFDMADCGCRKDELDISHCDLCNMETVKCNCNPYGTCQCA
jgi:hypothetical protein